MLGTILATKEGMSYRFTPAGRRVPVTILHTGPQTVIRRKTKEKDGYIAVQIGFDWRKHAGKSMLGQVKKAKMKTAPRFIREVRIFDGEDEQFNPGMTVDPTDILLPGTTVKVTGCSKGRGFAGVVKRWGFAGGPATHGQSDRLRAPGAIGSGTTPGRVYRGKKMAGRMGGVTVSVRNLQVLTVDKEAQRIVISGAVPGPRRGLVAVTVLARPKEERQMVWKELSR